MIYGINYRSKIGFRALNTLYKSELREHLPLVESAVINGICSVTRWVVI